VIGIRGVRGVRGEEACNVWFRGRWDCLIHHGLVRWESRMAFACPHGSSGSSTVSLLISVILAPFSGMYSHEVGGKKKRDL